MAATSSAKVTSVSPNSGSTSGTGSIQSVTIGGQGFTGATAVQFGNVGAPYFTVISDTSITTCVPAAHDPGTVDVRVNLPTGLTPVTHQDHYKYQNPPSITSLSTTSGPNAGSTSVTINGTGFTGATQVLFGQTPATIQGSVTDTAITVTSPAGSGTVDVTVITTVGTSPIVPADQFMYSTIPFKVIIPDSVATQGVYLSMYGSLQQQYTNTLGTTIQSGTNVILINTSNNAYDYIVKYSA